MKYYIFISRQKYETCKQFLFIQYNYFKNSRAKSMFLHPIAYVLFSILIITCKSKHPFVAV